MHNALRYRTWPLVVFVFAGTVLQAAGGGSEPARLHIPDPPPRPYTKEAVFRIGWLSQHADEKLGAFVCREEIQRHVGETRIPSRRSQERLTARVSYDGAAEEYSERLRDFQNDAPEFSELEGAWSTAEFGTLLHQTEILMQQNTPEFKGFGFYNGTWIAAYALGADLRDSFWDLKVDDQHYLIPFETEVWISTATAKVQRIARHATKVPSHLGIAAVDWSIDLADFDLGGSSWRLPKTGEYSVRYSGGRSREWNSMKFSDYRRVDPLQLSKASKLPAAE